ncbi:MAG TPA: hypothetical protein VIJ85_13030 [Rhizomicrobium sp.]
MLTGAFWIMAAAVLLGGFLLTMHLRAAPLPHWLIAPGHGFLGALSIALLFFALLHVGVRGAKYGVASFGAVSLAIAAPAFVLGLAIFVLKRCARRGASLAISIHAVLAVTAFAVLLAYVGLGN